MKKNLIDFYFLMSYNNQVKWNHFLSFNSTFWADCLLSSLFDCVFFLFLQVDRADVCLGDGGSKSDCPSRVRYNALPFQWTLGFIHYWLCGNYFSNKHWTIYLPHFGKRVPLRRRRVVPNKNGSCASRGHYCMLFLFFGLSPKSVAVVGRNDDGDKFDNNRNFQNT